MPPSRHEIVRRCCVEGLLAHDEHLARDFEPEGGTALGLHLVRRFLLPGLTVTVDEVWDAPEDRVVARLTVRTPPRAAAGEPRTWPAVVIFRFRGDLIAGVWAVQDTLPMLQAIGVVDDDATIERRLDALTEGPGPGT